MTNKKASWLLTFAKQCVVGPMCGFSASHYCSTFLSVKSRRPPGRILAGSLIICLVCASRVEAVLHGAKAKITSREKKQSRDVWSVEGLLHPGLKRTLFTFKQRSLVAVELQYEYPEWSIERYNQRRGEIRKYFDEKYGTGKLVSRSRGNDTDVIQTLVGYQWMVGGTLLELFYFSAQHDSLLYRTITVDYKAL